MDGSRTWVPATHMGNPDEFQTQSQPGPALAVVCIWGTNQQTEDLSPSVSLLVNLSLSLSLCLFNKNEKGTVLWHSGFRCHLQCRYLM